MKKTTFFILGISIMIFAYSCKNKETDKEKLKEEVMEELLNEMEKEDLESEKELQTTIVNQRKVVDVNNLKVGDEVFGLTVKDTDIKAYNNFRISFAGEFILEGMVSLSDYDESITFGTAEPTAANAILKSGDIEKPFFMLWDIRNKQQFKAALGKERLEKINQWQKVPLRIKFENYRIAANEFYIQGSAAFLEIME